MTLYGVSFDIFGIYRVAVVASVVIAALSFASLFFVNKVRTKEAAE